MEEFGATWTTVELSFTCCTSLPCRADSDEHTHMPLRRRGGELFPTIPTIPTSAGAAELPLRTSSQQSPSRLSGALTKRLLLCCSASGSVIDVPTSSPVASSNASSSTKAVAATTPLTAASCPRKFSVSWTCAPIRSMRQQVTPVCNLGVKRFTSLGVKRFT